MLFSESKYAESLMKKTKGYQDFFVPKITKASTYKATIRYKKSHEFNLIQFTACKHGLYTLLNIMYKQYQYVPQYVHPKSVKSTRILTAILKLGKSTLAMLSTIIYV